MRLFVWDNLVLLLDVYVIVHVATYLFFVHVLSKPHLKCHGNKELKEKYGPFLRNDIDNWGLLRPSNWFSIFTYWPRILFGIEMILACLGWMLILTAGLDRKKPEIGPIRRQLIRFGVTIYCRIALFSCGLFWINTEYVSTNEGDYSKWLGPNWKPKWTNPSTIVSNHVCWMDIVSSLMLFCPSFVSKASIRNFPGIGRIAVAIDCVFLDRAGSKEEKLKAAKVIEERQAENELTDRPPILIYPEGATTNNEQIITFKRGAFSGLHSIQPLSLKYESLNGISTQNDTLYSALHFYFIALNLGVTLNMKIYPVFIPNDYFWQHHLKQGEEKWQAYARVIREEIIAKGWDFKLVDLSMEKKLELKAIMKGKKVAKDD